jgi:hypothetical protein
MYEVSTSAAFDDWRRHLLKGMYNLNPVESGKPSQGGRPTLTSAKKPFSNAGHFHIYYYQPGSRWMIGSRSEDGSWMTFRSAMTQSYCADGASGWEYKDGGVWTAVPVTVTIQCIAYSPPAPPPMLVTSSMITCLPQMTQDACTYFATAKGRAYKKDLKTCFGVAAGGYDACDKDEGAPLVVHGAHNKMVQVGIASKVGCGAANTPTEYTKVSAFKDWILAQIGDIKLKCMHTCPVDGCTNVAFPGERDLPCRRVPGCMICNSHGWGRRD